MGLKKLPLKKRRASGKPQKPSADQKFPVRLEVKDSTSSFGFLCEYLAHEAGNCRIAAGKVSQIGG